MPIFQYQCECGYITEEINKGDIDTCKCEKCGKTANKILSKSNWLINGSCYNHLAPLERKENIKKSSQNKKILVDLYCSKCKKRYDNEFIYSDEPITKKCDECNVVLDRIFNYASFELKYDPKKDICDWAGNSSQYWNDVKSQRREGKKVKAINE